MLKKFFAVFSALTLILSALCLNAFCAEPVKLSISSATVDPDGDVKIHLYISENSKLGGAVIDVSYNPDILEFTEGAAGELLPADATVSVKNLGSKIRFAYMAPSSQLTSGGILMTMTFKGVSSGVSDLKISVPTPGDFVSSDLSRLAYTAQNGKVTVTGNVTAAPTESKALSETLTETETVTETETEPETVTDGSVNISQSEQTVYEQTSEKSDNILLIVICTAGVALIVAGAVIFLVNKKRTAKKG